MATIKVNVTRTIDIVIEVDAKDNDDAIAKVASHGFKLPDISEWNVFGWEFEVREDLLFAGSHRKILR